MCIREVQDTLQDSVHQLIVDKINHYGLGGFTITDRAITHKNGSYIIFKGMQHYNATNIKSLEGFDIAWVEEAQSFSQVSFDMLYPTIRKPMSELWFSWNPHKAADPVDKFFRSGPPDPDVVSVEANWKDNPWFDEDGGVMRKDMERDFRNDPDKAEHIWNGAYHVITEGAYYARLMLQAQKENRIAAVPHNPSLPVYTSWDLGVGDDTSIWFAQRSGGWIHVIDHHTANGQDAAYYVDVLRRRPYTYARHFLPHDAENREWTNGKSRLATLKNLGLENCKIVPKMPVDDGINAVRLLLPLCRFDAEKCKVGIESLRSYQRAKNKKTNVFKDVPDHDETSHDADAFRYLACGLEPDAAVPPDIPRYSSRRRRGEATETESGWAA